MITGERMIDYVMDLVRIDSLSRHEGAICERLRAELLALGAEVIVDDAGEKVGGETGNLFARLRGTVDGPPIVLSAHMDTVVPGEGVAPVRDGESIRSDGRTILGGDDKSGVAIIMEVLRTLVEQRHPHSGVEVVFTICEEIGLLGAKHFDVNRLKARDGLVLDSDCAGCLFIRGPAADRIEFTVHGLEAHSGLCPEKGMSAIQIASQAIAGMKLGRIDSETTANIGLIHGGDAVNIIPRETVVRGEARSHDEVKLTAQTSHMRRCFADAAAQFRVSVDGVEHRAQLTERVERDYDVLRVPEDSRIVRRVEQAARHLGSPITLQSIGVGCDANVFNSKGLIVANLGTGMRAIHTVKEHLLIDEFLRSGRTVFETVRSHLVAEA